MARAKGEAASVLLEAQGYREQKIARARGEAARFSALLDEYRQAPRVTRERLYLESMGAVLSGSNLILLGADNGSPLLYMPLQEMLGKQGSGGGTTVPLSRGSTAGSGSGSSSGSGQSDRTQNVDPLRSRERRP